MDPKDVASYALLAETGIVALVNLYKQIEANHTGSVKPLIDVLADADKAFQSIQDTAQAEIDANK